MRHIAGFAGFVFLMLPVACLAETWKAVPLVDVGCSAKAKAKPDAHTRDCALACAKTGFGIVTPDGEFLKLDAKGNEQAIDALKSTTKSDHLRVTVNGTHKGDTIQVTSLTL